MLSHPCPPALVTLSHTPPELTFAWNMSLQPFDVTLTNPNCAESSICPTTWTLPKLSTAQSFAQSSPEPPAKAVQVKLPVPSN